MSNLGSRKWRRTRALVFAIWGDTCHLCGHAGAGEVDHLVSRSRGGATLDVENCRPSHGYMSRCWRCDPVRGRACNQSRGSRALQPRQSYVTNTSRAW